jgi:hypothetical protein
MKAKIGVIFGCIMLIASTYSLACGGGGCNSGCGGDGYTDYTGTCDCTDPGCGPKGYNDCISKNECCEVFGNVGMR